MEVCLSPAEAPAWNCILTPAQQLAADELLSGLACGNVLVLQGDVGQGKTTILRYVQTHAHGVFLGMREFMHALDAREPFAVEEAWIQLMEASLAVYDLVLLDDMHLIAGVAGGFSYPRQNLLDAAITAVLERASENKKLVFAVEEDAPGPISRRAQTFTIAEFTPADYEAICRAYLGRRADLLDYSRIHSFAPALNAHQLKTACGCMSSTSDLSTESFIEYLGSRNLASNVDIDEVEAVDWNDLKGVDDVIHALDVKIALPFEEHELAARFQLKPKRGVLLAGPPGTGKTTIGRALAHRLSSKFFLIDGTVIADARDFYCKVEKIFEAAKRNAPSIIFIDDADVIFEGGNKEGLYRYLLTMLDGLEGASAARVCVMMTAMNVGSLPAALVRSGRIELWLETRLPDEAARRTILAERIASLPAPLDSVNTATLARASGRLTGADLKAAVEDAKLLYAYDWSRGLGARAAEEYFLEAIATIRKNRRDYVQRKPSEISEAPRVGFCLETSDR
jgi:transitional endoplasmic reticulum ATPase